MMNLEFTEQSENGISKTIQFNGYEDFIHLDNEEYDIPSLPYENLFSKLNYGIDILSPYNDGEDFIIVKLFNRWKLLENDVESFIGHLYGNSFPPAEKNRFFRCYSKGI